MVHVNAAKTSAIALGVRLAVSTESFYSGSSEAPLNNRPPTPIGTRSVLKFVEKSSSDNSSTSTPNSFLSVFWDVIAQGGGGLADLYEVSSADAPINPYENFLPTSRNFFTYPGSLTVYPCDEIVSWVVFEEPVVVFAGDIDYLRDIVAASPYTITFS